MVLNQQLNQIKMTFYKYVLFAILLVSINHIFSNGSLFNNLNSNNKKHGIWHEPGQPNKLGQRSNILIGKYDNGIKVGFWTEYDSKDNVVKIMNYNNDYISDTVEITQYTFNSGKVIREICYFQIKDSSLIDSLLLPNGNSDSINYVKFYPNKIVIKYNYEYVRDYDSLNPIILIRKEEE